MADEITRHSSADRMAAAAAAAEKERHDMVEDVPPAEQRPSSLAVMDPTRRAAVEKSMKRKLDLRCSLFILIYIMNYLDRNNIAAARLRGLEDDLDLSGTEYATCLSILYVGYILMQVSRGPLPRAMLSAGGR
jgi:hypothetical protein